VGKSGLADLGQLMGNPIGKRERERDRDRDTEGYTNRI
jgi:hypothetical protein